MRVCVCVRARARVRMCVCVDVSAWMRMCVCVCMLINVITIQMELRLTEFEITGHHSFPCIFCLQLSQMSNTYGMDLYFKKEFLQYTGR